MQFPVRLLSLPVLVLIWQAVAMMAQSPLVPTPLQVLDAFLRELQHGPLLVDTAITLARVAASFTLAMLVGTAIGIALGRARGLDRFFDPWLVLFLNLPALVVIVLAYVWFGLTEAAAIGAVAVNKIPTVAVTVREGARALDRDLLEMARAFRLSRIRTLRAVILPQLVPYLFGAARSGLALVWKIVLVVELLGRSSGVGFRIHLYFQLFDVATILAWALGFVAIVQLIEVGLMQPLERRLTRWRQ